MFVLRWCTRGRCANSASRVLVGLTAVLAASIGGCSQRAAYGPSHASRLAPPVAVAASTAETSPRADLEDDGLPAQTPPLLNRQRQPDNPAEPFSPNYGSAPVRSAAVTREPSYNLVSARALPDDLPPDFRERLIVATGAR